MSKVKDWIITGCLVVASLSVAALAVSRFFSSTQVQHSAGPQTVSDWRRFGSGGTRIGPAQAPVTIVLFSDFECQWCALQYPALMANKHQFGNQVAVVYRHYLGRSDSRSAAIAAECAHRQDKFDGFARLLFAQPDSIGVKPWPTFASQSLVPDAKAFEACLEDQGIGARVDADYDMAKDLGVRGTPSILINDRLYVGYRDSSAMHVLITAALEEHE